MNIGTLDFEVVVKKDMLSKSLDEAKDSLKNFSEAVKSGGANAQQAMTAAAAQIETAWEKLTNIGDTNRQALKQLEKEYSELGVKAGAAFRKATAEGDKEYRALTERRTALSKEIQERKSILQEVEKLTEELQKEEKAYNQLAEKTAKNESRIVSFRQQIRMLREEMAMQEIQAQETGGAAAVMALHGTKAFQDMQEKVAMLTDAMGDAQQQAQILSHDNLGLQGVISAVSGVAGAMSVAQGAVGLFAEENENLELIMTKVQSIMAVVMGLQQVADMLNKDSAASLTILNKARTTFVLEMQRSNAALATNTTATMANTTATTGNAVATNAAVASVTMFRRANILLSASFKAVGAAIKSIPVIGWIIAGVAGLVAIIKALTKSSREAKKAQEEYYKAVAEGAKEPTAQIEKLAAQWQKLTNDTAEKQKFIEDNAAAFETLGVKIKDVRDAEKLLSEHKDDFINAQIAKSKAIAATNKAAELQTERLNLLLEKENYLSEKDWYNARKTQREIDDLDAQIKDLYDKAIEAEKDGAEELAKVGLEVAKTYTQGSVGWYEEAIQKKQNMLKEIADPQEYKKTQQEIAKMQKALDGITGSQASQNSKDPYIEKLEKRKKQYADYAKWANSTDVILQGAAQKQFETLLNEGKNFLDYLEKQRAALIEKMGNHGTKEQQKQLQTLNEKIAEETSSTILEEFDRRIEQQLNGANSLLDKLAIIENERKKIEKESGYVADEERKRLAEETQQVALEMQQDYHTAKQEYYDYLDSRLSSFERYQQEMAKLEQRLSQTTNDVEIGAIKQQMEILTQRQKTATEQSYDVLANEYVTLEKQKLALSQEYDEKRRVATLKGDTELLKRIEKDYETKLQVMINDYLENDIIAEYLNKLDVVTVEALDKLIEDVETRKIGLPLDVEDKDINNVLKNIKKLRKEIAAQNPFFQLKVAFDDLKEAVASGELTEAVANVGVAMGAVGNVTSEVAQAIDWMEGDAAEAVKTILESSTTVLSSAATGITSITDLAKASVKGEEEAAEGASRAVRAVETASVILMVITAALKIIQGVVKAITYFTNKSEEKKLEAYENKVKSIEAAYKDLERQIEKTYSSERYQLQESLIAEKQRLLAEHKNRLAYLEELKREDDKDFDQDEYDALTQSITDLEDEIYQDITTFEEDLTQTTIPEIGDSITDALINAFAEGMSDSEIDKTIEKLVNDMMKNAAIHMAKTQMLMPLITEWYNNFVDAMNSDNELTEEERQRLQDEAIAATQQFQDRIKEINAMFGDVEADTNTLSGALKGASQESIDLLAGYTNATRITLIEIVGLFGRQLSLMASVDARVANAVEYLELIYKRMPTSNTTTTSVVSQQNISQRPYGIIE